MFDRQWEELNKVPLELDECPNGDNGEEKVQNTEGLDALGVLGIEDYEGNVDAWEGGFAPNH